MRTDKLVYLIFKRLPQGFFSLIGRNPDDAQNYLFKSVELKETAFRIDAIFQPKTDDITYFVEAQFQPDEDLYKRFFAEIFLYLKQFDASDWQGVVIYPNRNIEPKKIRPYQKLLEVGLAKRIYLDELPSRKDDPATLFKLLVEPERSASELAREMVEGSSALYLDVVQQILFYKFKDKSRREIMKMLGIEEEILRETRAFQEILEEGRQEGIEKGRAEGIEKGRMEGKLETVPLLRRLGLSDEQIAKELNLPLAEVQSVPKKSD
ncbi:MAG: Rpn family recombination-promoting nuclease/putative transposase [Chloroherpetonaceae bacterium]|nr:Rpn family recombination-promoting nuclease/putative transposase [Chloroherpetonaceae bacterium]